MPKRESSYQITGDAPHLGPNTAYLNFGPHHIALTVGVPKVASALRSTLGPMLARARSGTSLGCFAVSDHTDGISIAGPGAPAGERFLDPESASRELFHLAVQHLISARSDLLWIHGGVVAREGRAILFSAPSGQGKSSIVAEFIARGWSYFSDDIAPVDPVDGVVLPFPITPYRRVNSPGVLSTADARRLDKVRVEIPQSTMGTIAVPLAGSYFLSYHPAATQTERSDCSPGQAVVEMLKNSLRSAAFRDGEIRGLCALMSRVPSAYLRYASARDVAEEIALAHSE